MKRIIIFLLLGFGFAAAHAQESLKLNPVVGKTQFLRITTGDASIDFEGYDGDVLIIEPVKTPESTPALAKGLNRLPLHNEPVKDSIGYKIIQNDSTLFDLWIRGTTYKHLLVRVPNHRFAWLNIQASSIMPQTAISVKNITGEFKLTAGVETVRVSHVTGPFTINGKTDKIILTDILWKQFPDDEAQPYSISSDKDVDITLPPDLKADIAGGPITGRLYSDLNLIPHKTSVKAASTHAIIGYFGQQKFLTQDMTLNGGGIKIRVASLYGNIYLRKAQ